MNSPMENLERTWRPDGRRCTARARSTGEQCARQPIPGGAVCVMHGGSAPGAQQAAKLRLLAMVEPVLSAFEEILESWRRTKCKACGHPTGDPAPVIKVGQLVLDRSGFHPTLTVEQAAPPNPYEGLTEDQIIERLEAMLTGLRARRDERPLAAADPLLLDAYEVPEGDDVRSTPFEDAAKEDPSD